MAFYMISNKQKSRIAIFENLRRIADELFLAAEGMYVAYLFSLTTTLGLKFPDGVTDIFGAVLTLFGVLRLIVFTVTFFINKKLREDIDFRHFMIPMGISAVFFVYYNSFIDTGYDFLVFLIVLTVGNLGIYYKWIVTTYAISASISFLSVVILGLGGSIQDIVFYENGSIRGSLGICYPTDMAAYLFYIMLALAVILDKLPYWFVAVAGILSFLVSRFIASSDTSAICSLLFIAVAGILELDKRFFKSEKRILRILRLVFKWLVIMSFLIMGSFIIRMMIGYDLNEEAGTSLNELMNFRLSLASDAWNKYGVTPFGTPFDQEGAGFSSIINPNYNFVDSSYPLIIIRYGLFVIALVSGIWMYISSRALKVNRRLAAALVVIAAHSVMEHHFTEVNFNIFLVLPFASFLEMDSNDEKYVIIKDKKNRKSFFRRLISGGVIAGYVAFLLCFLPRVIDRIKTLFTLNKDAENGVTLLTVVFIMISVSLIVISVWELIRICDIMIIKRKGFKDVETAIPIFFLGMIFIPGFLIVSGIEVNEKSDNISKLIECERRVIEGMLQAAEGKVYECEYPEVYEKEFKGLSNSLFSGEELARKKGITVIMEPDTDSSAFISKGYDVCALSDEHVIYTDDDSVRDYLTEQGYELKWFNPSAHNVDLEKLAHYSDIEYSGRGSLLLMGDENSIDHGPYLSFNDGLYVVKYYMSIDPADYGEDHYVGTISVRRRYGVDEMAREDIFTDMFDAAGNLEKQYEVWLQGVGCEFLFYVGNNSRVEITKITYKRIQ